MKKTSLLLFFTLSVFVAYPQAVSSLSENFNGACASVSGYPTGWVRYNPIGATIPSGVWTCAPSGGRSGTPGISCTGTYSATYNVDTAFLVSPLLNFHGFSHVYLSFDSKTTNIHLGGKLAILINGSPDSMSSIPVLDTDITGTVYPVFGNSDSSDWVTHHVDLSSHISSGNFYIAFRYTSNTSGGSIWFLDNINTSTAQIWLDVPGITNDILPIRVIGNSASDHIAISYNSSTTGQYKLALYDMMGRELYTDIINAHSGAANYTINNVNLHPGMYFIKMFNNTSYGVTKVMIQ
jgi:hypothetical protein